jgi:hypothetical protein
MAGQIPRPSQLVDQTDARSQRFFSYPTPPNGDCFGIAIKAVELDEIEARVAELERAAEEPATADKFPAEAKSIRADPSQG